MAKLSLNNQENPFAVAIFGSLGFLMCLIFTVLGIKLWWFKHRLSFEQTTLQNGAAGGAQPNVVVTRREKKSRFSKDKRLSQQVYHSVEVHGVFKQKKEDDDMSMQGTSQLPPVRLRQAESAPSLLLPPPRNKRRPQYVQSTAFEELGELYDNATPSPAYSQEALHHTPSPTPPPPHPATTASIVHEKNPGVSLTFEEVQNEFKPDDLRRENGVITTTEVPEPPKRVNRSSSTSVQQQRVQEKPHRFLKTSQSISVPEFHKVIERRPTGFHRPPEIDDLTKIDDLEEPPFEKFGERRPTGYIKYEEVDFPADLRDYREANEMEDFEEIKHFYDSGYLDNRNMEPIEALRDEEIIYQNPTSPDICEINEAIENYEKSALQSNQRENKSYNDLSKTSTVNEDFANTKQSKFYHKEENNFERTRTTDFTKTNEVQKRSEKNVEPQSVTAENNLKNSRTLNESQLAQGSNDFVHNKFENVVNSPNISQRIVSFDGTDNEENLEKSTLNQRRPTAYVREDPGFGSDEELQYFENRNYEPIKSNDEFKPITKQYLELQTSEKSATNLNQQSVKFQMGGKMNGLLDVEDKFTLNQRRPTEFVRTAMNENYEDDDWTPQTVTFDVNSYETEGYEDKFTLNQRRPTTYVRAKLEQDEGEDETQEQTVRFDLNKDSYQGNEDKFTLNQRRPTAYVRAETEKDEETQEQTVRFDQAEDHEEKFTLNQRRPTAFIRLQQEEAEQQSMVTFDLKENSEDSQGYDDKFTLNQRRPTAYNQNKQEKENYKDGQVQENGYYAATVKFDVEEIEHSTEKFTLNQRRPTKYNNSQDEQEAYSDTFKQVQFKESDKTDGGTPKNANTNDLLQSCRPTAFVIKSKAGNPEKDHDTIWQELEQDIESDFAQNIEEEFARIRQSFELNEADFLELKDELQLGSPPILPASAPPSSTYLQNDKPTGFGKSIDDDWENFEKLKPVQKNAYEIVQDHEDIRITYNRDGKEQDITTVSILKESKFEQTTEVAKPRKSKVTFDFKTEEHLIPARKSPSDEEYDSRDDDDEFYNKHPPPIPRQRLTSLNYSEDNFYEPVVAPPTTISLFGSTISQMNEAEDWEEDSWSAIRKHRHLTSQFQNLTLDSGNSPPPPSQPPPPLPASRDMDAPKPAYRNPMAQLAVQRCKEVRSEMEGFKSRSIKDAKKRSSQEVLNLRNDSADTEA